MRRFIICSFLFLSPFVLSVAAEPVIVPDGTYLFAKRDTCDLFLDVYQPGKEGVSVEAGPTVLFIFGGGFITGARDKDYYLPWFKELCDNGFRVVSIDYRLGLKGAGKVGLAQAKLVEAAVMMAVDDAFSATAFLCENAGQLGIDTSAIVISGSSAGAITSLQAEYEICNRTARTSVLPEGFNYAGVMSFSGAIVNMKGRLGYKSEPCPQMLLHGTDDKIVNYKKVGLGNMGLFGSSHIVKLLKRRGYTDYRFYRFPGHQHEIASSMPVTTDLQLPFLLDAVMGGDHATVDKEVENPKIPMPKSKGTLKDLYGN